MLQWVQRSYGSLWSRHLHPSLLCYTHWWTTHTDTPTDTMGCLPTSPITGLFIRVSYRQYWQPADTQSLQHKQMEQQRRAREGGMEGKRPVIAVFCWGVLSANQEWVKAATAATSSAPTHPHTSSSHTHNDLWHSFYIPGHPWDSWPILITIMGKCHIEA